MKFAAPTVRASNWGNNDGTQQPVVRVSTGKQTLVVEYRDIAPLIADLAKLLHAHIQEGDDGNR